MIETASKGAILITGASTGIGRGSALHLDRLGYTVYAGVRKPADGDALKAAASPKLTPVTLDVTNQEHIDAVYSLLDDALDGNPLLGLVNNAGIAVGGPMEFVPMEDVRWQFEVNLFGQIAVTQKMMPLLRRGQGRIVNMGSIAGKVTSPFMGPYCASKHAFEAVTDAQRIELRKWGIWSCVIEPGRIKTPIWEKGKQSVDEGKDKLPEEGMTLYGKALEGMRRAIIQADNDGIEVHAVSKAVEHALLSKSPKTRYVVGPDARSAAFIRWLIPDTWMDWLITKSYKLN